MKTKVLLFINAVLFSVAVLTLRVQAIPDYELRILTVEINPVENGQDLVSTYFGGNAEAIKDEAFGTAIDAFYDFSAGKIHYEIVDELVIDEFPEVNDGTPAFTFETYDRCVGPMTADDYTFCDSRKYAFDYIKFFNDYEICQAANSADVDEIWIIGAPYVGIYESFIIGPESSFFINGPDFINTNCHKLYPALGPTWDRPENLLHNYSHRIESTLAYIFSNVNVTQRNQYFSRFVGFDGQPRRCGNGHFPVNARGEYDVSNPANGRFYCVDWRNFPNHTNTSVLIGCSAWGCTDAGWQEFWFSYVPREDGTANLLNRSGQTIEISRNWWEYILSPVTAKEFVRNSYEPGSEPPECTVLEWSDWSVCTGEQQTRTALRTTPLICSDYGGLEETRSCPGCFNYTYSDWGECVDGVQSRTFEEAPAYCPGETLEDLTQSCVVEPPVCTVTEWSDWSTCIGGEQFRTAVETDPASCIPDEDTETRSCTEEPLCTVSVWSDWSECENDEQFRVALETDPTLCTPDEDTETRSCVSEPPECNVTEWSEWSDCLDGNQFRTPIETNPAMCTPDVTSEAQSCTCTIYEYSAWGACLNGTQTRTYIEDQGSCPGNTLEELSRSCTVTPPVSTPVSTPTTTNPNNNTTTNSATSGANTANNNQTVVPVSSPIVVKPPISNGNNNSPTGQTPSTPGEQPQEEQGSSNTAVTVAIVGAVVTSMGAGTYFFFFRKPF